MWNMKYSGIIFFILFLWVSVCTEVVAQELEFYGAVKLEGLDEKAISYKLVLIREKDKVSGYSITDITGDHETKSKITGTYDEKTKMLKFRETGIIYTKSPISRESFCFIHYQGKIKLTAKTSKISGAFKGRFKDNTTCIDGTLELIGSEKVTTILNKVNTKIQKSRELDDESKQKYNPVKIFDSLQVHQIKSNENLSIFNSTADITFDIWDHGNEDGDIINFYYNDEIILKNFVVLNQKKQFSVSLKHRENHFRIEAVNQGSQGLNTAMVTVTGDNKVKFLSNLQQGETSQITIIRE